MGSRELGILVGLRGFVNFFLHNRRF